MIVKVNNEFIHIDMNEYTNTKSMYISLWKHMYNITLNSDSLNINGMNDYLKNNNIYI